MDIAVFILIIIALVGLFILLTRSEAGTKNRHKEKAESLLATSDAPDTKEVRETIKYLRLYSGRIFKDKEALRLADNLREKYGHLL
jgi:hypothetical protein